MRTNTYLQGVPRPPETYDILLNNFSGGLNNRSEIIQDHESPYVLNMRYDDSLGFVKREGTELYDNVELNGAIIHVDEFKPYNAPDELYEQQNKLYMLAINISRVYLVKSVVLITLVATSLLMGILYMCMVKFLPRILPTQKY